MGVFSALVFCQFNLQLGDGLVEFLYLLQIVVVEVADHFVLIDALDGCFFVEDDLVAVDAIAQGTLEQYLLGRIVERLPCQIQVQGLKRVN